MDAKEILTKISEVLEKIGVKEALKSPEVVETIYNVMSKHGMKVDKGIFSLVVMGFATMPVEKIGDLLKMGAGMLGGANANGGAAGDAGALGALAGILGGQQQQAQSQTTAQAANNPLAALGALGALAGALNGNAQPQQNQSQAQTQQPNQQANLADAVNAVAGIAKMLQQK